MLIQDIIERDLKGIIDAPDFLLEKIFIQTVQRFLNETWILLSRYEYEFTDKDKLEYNFPDFSDKNILSIKAYQKLQSVDTDIVYLDDVFIGEKKVIFNNILVDFVNQVIIFPQSFVNANDSCYVWFICNYKDNITEIDDFIYNHYRDGLIGGTIVLASLRYGIQPAQGLELFSADYNNAIAKAKMLNNNNYFTKKIMIEQRKFI